MRAICVLAAVLCAVAALTPPAAFAAPPRIGAPAAIVIDAETGQTLYARRPDSRRPIASTTKLMTALVALERGRDSQRIASPGYAPGPEEVTIGLVRGERMTLHDLLLALLLPSANDAAMTIAHGIGGSEAAFVRAMNEQAAALGLTGTSYANPVGLDSPDNYSTARDLAHLAALLLARPAFARIVDRPRAVLTSGLHRRVVVNRNDLVARYPFVKGVKTGHTNKAGYVLVAAARAHGAEVVSVVLDEPSEAAQDADSLSLLRFGLSRFERIKALARGETLARPKVRYYGDDRTRLVAAGEVDVVAVRGQAPTLRVDAPARLTGPIPRGRRVGAVTVFYAGRPLRTVPLVTADAVKGAGLLRRLGTAVDAALAAVAFLVLGGAAASVLLVRSRRAERSRG
jgi:serine-type D-Ala-D-Ala carboxypeptidase (penicillin-binding protein 5/6)